MTRPIYASLLLPFAFVQPVCAQEAAFVTDDSVYRVTKEMQEVVVTAEKREMRPLDAPVAVTVVQGKDLPGGNAPDIRTLSGTIPNFYMQESGLKLSAPVYIRGVGTVSGTPPVGLYVDGIPVFDKNAFVFELYDIRQVEVLRGPQTTLYGRNSINGLIHITTRPAGDTPAVRAKAGFAGHYSQSYGVTADLPVGGAWRNKFLFSYNKSKGYFRNQADGGRRSNPTDAYCIGYRGDVFAAREWRIRAGIDFRHSYDGGYAYFAVDSLKRHRYDVNYNTPSSYKRDMLHSFAEVNKTWHGAALQSTTSFARTLDWQVMDADFTRLDVFDNRKKSWQNQVTQEISLRSTPVGRSEWAVGAFAFFKHLHNDYLASFGKDRTYLLPIPLDRAAYLNTTKTKGIAGYGQYTLKALWPGMSATVGIRYDCESADLSYSDSVRFARDVAYRPFHALDTRNTFHAWLPKFALMQKWNDRLSLYLTVSKGYKAGGFNVIADNMGLMDVDLKYGREKLWNYEVGAKYVSPTGTFRASTALFCIDWKDQQIFVMGMMGPTIRNAGDTRSVGGEVEIAAEPLRGLLFNASFGYSHSAYYHHETPEYEDNRTVMAPDFTANAGVTYRRAFRSSWLTSGSAAFNATAIGTQYFDEANRLKQSPYMLCNAEITLSGKHVDLRLWGRNLFDRHFFAYMLNNPVGKKLPQYNEMGQSGAPADFGMAIVLKLK